MINKITDRIYFLPAEGYSNKHALGYIKGDNLAFIIDGGSSKKQYNLLLAELEKQNPPYPIIKARDIVFESKLAINLGNINCHLINIDENPCEDSVIVWIPEEKVIFLGDIYNKEMLNKEPQGYENRISKVIQFLYETDFEYAISSSKGIIKRKELIESLEKEYRKIA